MDKDEPCKFISNNLAFCHPSIPESCMCGTSTEDTVASIPRSSDWPVSFPLQSAMEYVSALGLNPEIIVSTISNKLRGRIAYSEDSYRKIGAYEKHIDIIRNGYKPLWKRQAPRQRITPSNPAVSLKAS